MKMLQMRNGTDSEKPLRKTKREAYHVASVGRERVRVYKRRAPNGSTCFMVANYANGKRRFDS